MSTLFSPLQLLSVALAGWMNRYQQAVIDYLVAENPPTGFARARRTGSAHGVRESTLGLQANGGGAEQSGI